MSKYDPLLTYLSQSRDESVPMGFSEIENVLGFELPPSSRRQRAWWSNNPTNNVMTQAWLDAGYETANVDMAGEKLMFKKVHETPPVRTRRDGEHPLFGALKGMLTLPPDLDLTLPADPEWADRLDD
jgi:hypothetical protein